jgi:aspartate dehydrogenase
MAMLKVVIIGLGAIGREVLRQLDSDPAISVTSSLLRPAWLSRAENAEMHPGIRLTHRVEEMEILPDFALECAGPSALDEHVIPLLRRGVNVGICSVGALIDDELAARVYEAAAVGGAQVHLLAGAVGGIDALSAAKLLGLESVTLTSRKPPLGWRGTPAEEVCSLRSLTEPVVIFEGSARDAARIFPKNANSAATVALAGIGLDRTKVTLIADPNLTRNTHEIHARGRFGEMRFVTTNHPLPDNPKTSTLAALSAVRAIRNQSATMVI